jgi:glycosyltransferase involved in cell wall biosynthesis
MKHIGLFSEATHFGGGERALIMTLKYLNREKFRVTLFCSQKLWQLEPFDELREKQITPYFIDDAAIEIADINESWLINFRYRGVCQILRSALVWRRFFKTQTTGIDLLHISNALNIAVILGARLTPIPKAVSAYRILPKGVYSNSAQRTKLWLNRFVTKQLDHIITPSAIGKELWAEALNIPRSKITVVNNGVECNESLCDLDSITKARESLGISTSLALMVVVAELAPHKGHEVLIQALSILKAQGREGLVETLIVGEGPLHNKLRDMTLSLGLEKIKFLGFIGNMKAIYQSADIVVLPTLYDHFPWALLEAMNEGKPVIASHVGGIPEIVDNHQTGLLVPPNDPESLAIAIEELISNELLRRKLGAAGWEKVKARFCVQEMVRSIENLYLELLG